MALAKVCSSDDLSVISLPSSPLSSRRRINSHGCRSILAQSSCLLGGYAKEMSDEWFAAANAMLLKECRTTDVIITTALIPGRAAPKLILQNMVRGERVATPCPAWFGQRVLAILVISNCWSSQLFLLLWSSRADCVYCRLKPCRLAASQSTWPLLQGVTSRQQYQAKWYSTAR